jgi:hypothetical protein
LRKWSSKVWIWSCGLQKKLPLRLQSNISLKVAELGLQKYFLQVAELRLWSQKKLCFVTFAKHCTCEHIPPPHIPPHYIFAVPTFHAHLHCRRNFYLFICLVVSVGRMGALRGTRTSGKSCLEVA